jgi:hypothetical protein
MKNKTNRPRTPTYYVFLLLFSTDAWRIAMGVVISILATPKLVPPTLPSSGQVMLYVMVAAIGWTVTGAPARWITGGLKRAILGDRRR